jgi:hypothetical protein
MEFIINKNSVLVACNLLSLYNLILPCNIFKLTKQGGLTRHAGSAKNPRPSDRPIRQPEKLVSDTLQKNPLNFIRTNPQSTFVDFFQKTPSNFIKKHAVPACVPHFFRRALKRFNNQPAVHQ